MHEQIRLFVNERLDIKQLTQSLKVQTDSISAKVFVQAPPLCKSVVILELAFVNFVPICTLDNGVIRSPKRREISLIFTCQRIIKVRYLQ